MDALIKVGGALQYDFFDRVKFYHFQYPEATDLLVLVTYVTVGTNTTKISIPQNFTLYSKSYFCRASDSDSALFVDGMEITRLTTENEQTAAKTGFFRGVINNGIFTIKDVFTLGQLHSIVVHSLGVTESSRFDGPSNAGVATVLVYTPGE